MLFIRRPPGHFLQKVSPKKVFSNLILNGQAVAELYERPEPGGPIMTAERQISSGGVIFRKSGSIVEVALISVKGGKVWGLPKGTVEKGENLARTAHREVHEETGLDGKILKNIGRIEYFFTIKDEENLRRVFKIVYFFLMEYTSGSVEDHDAEVDECRWFPINEAIKLMKYEDEKGILKKARKLIREFEKGGETGV